MPDVFDTAEAAAVADERTTLEAFLDYYREAVMAKVRGLSQEDALRRLVPSRTTLAGLIKHLIRVEVSWFQHRLAQIPSEELTALRWIEDDADGDFAVTSKETTESLIADYDAQCELSRRTAAKFQLDDVVPHPYLGRVSLRWIYVHMIEETARHAGHADILREQIDGTTGD
ncbi:MAG: DinB family protein [Actinomycetota bacterium]|nr:DinB family protein [Actinomycetota bacterium]